MIGPVFNVAVDDQRVMLQFEQFPAALKKNLRLEITKLTGELQAQVKAAEPVRTGRLRSLTRRFVDERQDRILGRVRVLGGAAAATLEYGAHKSFMVQAYTRQGGRISGYRRRANITARRFLHGPAAAMRARVVEALEEAVTQSVADAQNS